MKIDFKEKHSIHRKKPRRTKVENLDRYIDKCKYCSKEVYSQQSFVALVKTLNPISHYYAHYQCMREDHEKQQKDSRHNQF
jgi:hypothetical protein|tara:strand:+ start:543 stop:785 length:243 start_codon:yes stop_codon:yes gene_type:complete